MKKKLPLVTLIIGLVVLAAGGTFLAINLFSKPQTADAEYLVQIGAWAEENSSNAVVWNFTEIGKGTLTTNSHLNDYDFIWAIEGDTLKIEADWLYDLNNEYSYKLSQSTQKLVLTNKNGEEITFVPLGE